MSAGPLNRLLAALPPDEYVRLLPDLRTAQISEGGRLPGCGSERVYFPASSVCSIRQLMADGQRVEITTVGCEGLVGYPGLTVDQHGTAKSYVQITDGITQFMSLRAFERELALGGALRRVTNHYARVFLESLMCGASCNRLHSLQARCCRWLLLIHDRTCRSRFALSTSSMALALGASREEMHALLEILEHLKVVTVEHDTVWVRNPSRLARLACDCYPSLSTFVRPEQLASGNATATSESQEPANPRPGAEVIPLRPVTQCARCNLMTVTPHATDRDCIRALDSEMKMLLQRSRVLHRMRERLTREWLEGVKDFLEKPAQQTM